MKTTVILSFILGISTQTFAQIGSNTNVINPDFLVINAVQAVEGCEQSSGLYVCDQTGTLKVCDLANADQNAANSIFVGKNNSEINTLLRTCYDKNYYLKSQMVYPITPSGCGSQSVYVLAKK
jgi:hypothetical protein